MTRSFPATEYWKVFETGETFVGGGATFTRDAQLSKVIVTLYKQGTSTGTERMRAKLYHDFAMTKLYAVGAWTLLRSVIDLGTVVRASEVPLTFDTEPFVQTGQEYFVALEIDSYTRNGETFFIAADFNWPIKLNTSDSQQAIKMSFLERRGVRHQ